MSGLLSFSRAIDTINEQIGKIVAWFVIAAVVVSAGNAFMRYGLNWSSNAYLELQWYLFGFVFLFGAAWTFKTNEHVRIDILSSTFSKRTRDWIDVVCHVIFLMPFVFLHVYFAIPSFLSSFRANEVSTNAGGLLVWPARLIIIIGFTMLLFQGVSELIKRIAIIRGDIEDPAVLAASAAEEEVQRILAATAVADKPTLAPARAPVPVKH